MPLLMCRVCICVMMCVYSRGEAFILTRYSFSISHYFSYSYMLTDLPIIPKIMLDLKLMALETANIYCQLSSVTLNIQQIE